MSQVVNHVLLALTVLSAARLVPRHVSHALLAHLVLFQVHPLAQCAALAHQVHIALSLGLRHLLHVLVAPQAPIALSMVHQHQQYAYPVLLEATVPKWLLTVAQRAHCAPQEHSVLQQEHHLLQLVSPVHLDTIALVLMVLHIHVQKAVGMAIQVPQQ